MSIFGQMLKQFPQLIEKYQQQGGQGDPINTTFMPGNIPPPPQLSFRSAMPVQQQQQAQLGLPLILQQLYGPEAGARVSQPQPTKPDTVEGGFSTSPGFRPVVGDPLDNLFTPGFGQSIRNPGFRTADFRDSDGDGIDDRDQYGPGQPRYRPPGQPIFGIDPIFGSMPTTTPTLSELAAFNPIANSYALAGFTPGEILAMPEFSEYAKISDATGVGTGVGTSSLPLQRQGGGRDEQQGPGITTEVIGGKVFRVNEFGEVEQVNPSSFDAKFSKFMNDILSVSPTGMLKGIVDPRSTFDIMKNIQDKYGVETAKDFRDVAFGTRTPTKEVAEGEYTGPTARETQADKEARQERERIAAAAKAKEDKGGGYSGKSPSGGQMGSTGGGSGQSGPAGDAKDKGSFCFAPNTLIQMADGSEKEIQDIKLGDDTKGGKVELVVQTLGHNVYNYKGVEVSGSHWVVEDGEYIEVETSKHAKPIDDKEMLYCLNTSDHAIWIKDIQFSDFIGFGLDYSVPGVHKFWESIKDRHTESIN